MPSDVTVKALRRKVARAAYANEQLEQQTIRLRAIIVDLASHNIRMRQAIESALICWQNEAEPDWGELALALKAGGADLARLEPGESEDA